jgi:hypothetical protein
MSMKRQAPSPIQSEKAKESKNDKESPTWASIASGSNAGCDTPIEGGVPSSGASFRPRTNSITSSTSTMSTAVWKEETQGPMRVCFTVDILTRNGEPYKGSITPKEALTKIFVKALGFKANELHGITPGYKGNPTVLFRMKEPFNIDEKLQGKSKFDYEKKIQHEDGSTTTLKIGCGIKGIRERDPINQANMSSRFTYVKIEGAEYQLKEEDVMKWLSNYGTLMSEITEDQVKLEFSDSEEEEACQEIVSHTGTYSVKMALGRQIPQFLPMGGKKIKIYYRGIKKMCRKCYRAGHLWNDCKDKQREWLEYVDEFLLNHTLEEQLYGNWIRLVSDWRVRNQDLHEANKAKVVNQREYLRGQVEEIKTAMERQKEQESAPLSKNRDDKEDQKTDNTPCGEINIGKVQTKESQEKKIDALREEVSNMTVEELEEIVSSKKRGRPRKEEKDSKQLSKREQSRKKSISSGPNPKTANE